MQRQLCARLCHPIADQHPALERRGRSGARGEQGRGFAVVAGEVRSLAQRGAQASKEIRSLVGTSVEGVE